MNRYTNALFAAAIWLFAGTSAWATTSLDRIIAIVNDDVVTETELKERIASISQQLRQQRRTLPPSEVMQEQLLERLILEKLQLQEAKAIGIQVDDDTLNQTIKRIATDNNLNVAEFRDTLEKDGYDFTLFREDIRRELIIRRLHERQIHQRVVVSEQEVDQYLNKEPDQSNDDKEFRVAHILVAVPEAAMPEQVEKARMRIQTIQDQLAQGKDFSDIAAAYSDGQQALEGGDLGWRKLAELPVLFEPIITKLKVNQVSEVMRGANGFHLIKLMETRGEPEQLVEETRAQHILLTPNELRDETQTQAQLRALRERIVNGEDFTTLAKAHSEDKGSVAQGGSLGWVKPGETVPQFEQAMKSMQLGEISEPVESRFGWHIIQVLERRMVDNASHARRQKAQQALRQRRIDEDTESWLRRIRDEAYVEIRANSDPIAN